MLRPKTEEIRHGGLIGKCFIAGFVLGMGLECLSGKRTSYSSYLGVRLGLAGGCLYLAGKVAERYKNRVGQR